MSSVGCVGRQAANCSEMESSNINAASVSSVGQYPETDTRREEKLR